MLFDAQPNVGAVEIPAHEVDTDLDSPWVENIVTAAVATFTVLFVSSVAVVMYLA